MVPVSVEKTLCHVNCLICFALKFLKASDLTGGQGNAKRLIREWMVFSLAVAWSFGAMSTQICHVLLICGRYET